MTRPLPFPLQNPLEIVGDTPNDGVPLLPFTWPTLDSDEKIFVTMELSLNEYVKLASSVDIGRDIGYPIDTNLIWWIWVRAFRGESTLTCEQIIDCIENDPATGTALQQWLSSNGYGNAGPGGTYDTPSTYTANPTLLDPSQIPGCDPDILFGMGTQFIDAINAQISSFFAILEAESNGFERAAIIAEAIPGSDQAGFDTAAAGFDQVLEELAENYAANFTPTLRDEYRCDIFCLLKDTCDMDFQALADYFMARVGAAISLETFGDAVSWLIAGTWIGSQVCDAAFALVMQGVAYAQQIMNIDINWLVRGVAASLNDPDSDWTTLCTECPSDLFVPEIALTCNPTVNGTIDSQQASQTWRFTSTFRAAGNDWALTVKDDIDTTFSVTGFVPVSGAVSHFSSYCDLNGVLQNHGAGVPIGVPIKALFVAATATWTADITFAI